MGGDKLCAVTEIGSGHTANYVAHLQFYNVSLEARRPLIFPTSARCLLQWPSQTSHEKEMPIVSPRASLLVTRRSRHFVSTFFPRTLVFMPVSVQAPRKQTFTEKGFTRFCGSEFRMAPGSRDRAMRRTALARK